MTWIIVLCAIVVAAVIVMLAAGTAMFFDMGMVSDNFKKNLKPHNCWDEDENIPDKVVFNPSCHGFEKEILDARKRIKAGDVKVMTVKSFDGLTLKARFIPAENMRGVVVMMHGYRSNPLHDFALAVGIFQEMGFGCLLPYHRGHGDSEGKYIYFGARERYDVISWCETITKEYGEIPIILDGISMGASTVMMASGLDLPSNVKGIIADCGFTSPHDIFISFLKRYKNMSPFPFLYTTWLYAKLKAGFEMNASTTKALKKNRLPIFIAHGRNDNFVPFWMSEKNYEAAKESCDASFLPVPDADHGMSFLVEREKYIDEVKSLIYKCIK